MGIAGSTEIGKHCTLGGQVGVAGHIKVGDNTMVGAQSGIAGNMPGGEVVSGTPAIPHRDWLKAATSFSKLPEMRKEIKRLKKQVEELQGLTKEG